jgi:hypothetical protein
MDPSAVSTMARPKAKGAGGRPPAPEPLRSLMSVKGSAAFEAWLDGLVDHAHQGTRTLLLKNALREFAETHGYKKPQPKR